MKIIKKDLKNGILVLRIEVPDDFYYLSDVISKGDLVSSKTKRRVELDRDTHRPERIDKKTMTLGLEVDSVEFDRNVDRLRITGKIREGPETVPEGEFHTLNMWPGMTLSIKKEEWLDSDLVRVQDAVKTIKTKLLMVSIEEGNCSLGLLRNYGVQKVGKITRSISGKKEIEAKASETGKFFQEIQDAIENQEKLDKIIIAGPGFIKDNFKKFLTEKKSPVLKKVLIENVSMGGDTGLQEIVKRGIIEKVVKETKIQQEVSLLTKLFEEISKDSGLAAYGFKEVQNACNIGAVETLLISNDFLKKAKINKNSEVENLVKMIEGMKGNISIVSEEHDLGNQLSGLGGVAALLRYKIPE